MQERKGVAVGKVLELFGRREGAREGGKKGRRGRSKDL